MILNSAIYKGSVVHERVRPKWHNLRYRVFTLLLDIDELPALNENFLAFGYNRRAPMAFFDCDHGPADGTPLRPWVEKHLTNAGLSPDGGPIRILCYPRILGYVFNPLTVYFCYDHCTHLQAILYEVCNTYKERHTYVIPVNDGGDQVILQEVKKSMYVSPFMDMNSTYHFRIVPPSSRVNIVIRQEDSEGLLLAASFKGDRIEITGSKLAMTLMAFPLLTLKVTAGIHWEALQLWVKGLKFVSHTPADQPVDSSIGQPKPKRN